jgi:hypothetical protein
MNGERGRSRGLYAFGRGVLPSSLPTGSFESFPLPAPPVDATCSRAEAVLVEDPLLELDFDDV